MDILWIMGIRPVRYESVVREWQRNGCKARRARTAAARNHTGPVFYHGYEDHMLDHQHGRCAYCSVKFGYMRTYIDHVVPLARGGIHGISNMVLSCYDCNAEKGTRFLFTEWMPERPLRSVIARFCPISLHCEPANDTVCLDDTG